MIANEDCPTVVHHPVKWMSPGVMAGVEVGLGAENHQQMRKNVRRWLIAPVGQCSRYYRGEDSMCFAFRDERRAVVRKQE